MGDLKFAGNGMKDVDINKDSTDPGSLAGGGDTVIDFAGHGAKDVSHSNEPKNGSQAMPSGGDIVFAGEGKKDV